MRERRLREARWVANLSECTRSRVGAILVNRLGEVISVGFNHVDGEGTCTGGDCPRGRMSYEQVPQSTPFSGDGACIAEHAEEMALRLANEPVVGLTMYITREPCAGCAAKLTDAGVHYEV